MKYLALAMLAFIIGMFTGRHDASIAIQECLADLKQNCPALYNYAIILEEENSRLNQKLKNSYQLIQ